MEFFGISRLLVLFKPGVDWMGVHIGLDSMTNICGLKNTFGEVTLPKAVGYNQLSE